MHFPDFFSNWCTHPTKETLAREDTFGHNMYKRSAITVTSYVNCPQCSTQSQGSLDMSDSLHGMPQLSLVELLKHLNIRDMSKQVTEITSHPAFGKLRHFSPKIPQPAMIAQIIFRDMNMTNKSYWFANSEEQTLAEPLKSIASRIYAGVFKITKQCKPN